MLCLILKLTGAGVAGLSAQALEAMSTLEHRTLAYSIAVSTYAELVSMALRHGVSQVGDADQLRKNLFAFFNLFPPAPPSLSTKIRIQNAASVQYFDIGDLRGEAVLLKGPLSLIMETDDGVTHRVSAREILFQQQENIVIATGSVFYSRKGNGREDEFKGQKIIVDLDSYSGVFIDGSYDMAPQGRLGRNLFFRFDSLTRRGSDLSILEGTRVTACDEEKPHYHLRAAKVWLFENGDWAVSSATLYVGTVPVLWLPYFYYPADEIIFHPVIGYKSREGSFLQTTMYLLGDRKEKNEESSSLSLLETSQDGEKTYSGIFIKRLASQEGEEVKAGQSEGSSKKNTFKILADIYSALGAHVGAEGSFALGGKESLSFVAGLGISRSLFLQSNGYYSPFDAATDYASAWNRSNFLGLDLPFRFGLLAKYARNEAKGPLRFSFSLEAPLYSDPYFEQDFRQRSESSSIISAFSSKPPTLAKRSTMTQSLQASLAWTAPPASTSKLLSHASLSRFTSQAIWNSKTQSTSGMTAQEKRRLSVDPQREFFYPDSLKIADAAVQLSGVLASYPKIAEQTAKAKAPFTSILGWSLLGSGIAEEKFKSSPWQKPDAVDSSISYFLVGYKGVAQVNATATAWGNLLSLKTTLGISAQDQDRTYLFDERTSPTSVHPFKISDWAYQTVSSDLSNTITLAPLRGDSPFAASNLSYSLAANLYKYRYAGLDGTGLSATPRYEASGFEWSSQAIGTHAATASLRYAPKSGPSHQINLSTTLPPLSENYGASYSLAHPYFRATIQGTLSSLTAGAAVLPSALSATFSLGANPYPVFKTDFSWDFDVVAPKAIGASLEYRSAKASFMAKKSKGYDFSSGLWTPDGSEYFRPYESSISWSPTLGTPEKQASQAPLRPIRISFKPTLSYSQNFVRFTESIINLGIDFSLLSVDGTSLRFSSATANRSAWRYWTELFPESPGLDPDDYSRSLADDIVDSLSVWDAAALRRSLFKLSSLSMELSQDLHDWTLKAGLGMSPILITPDAGRPYYQLDFSFNLAVTWKDIPELKTSLDYREGVFR